MACWFWEKRKCVCATHNMFTLCQVHCWQFFQCMTTCWGITLCGLFSCRPDTNIHYCNFSRDSTVHICVNNHACMLFFIFLFMMYLIDVIWVFHRLFDSNNKILKFNRVLGHKRVCCLLSDWFFKKSKPRSPEIFCFAFLPVICVTSHMELTGSTYICLYIFNVNGIL